MKQLLLTILTLLSASYYSTAQITYEERLEIELKDDYDREEVIPFGDLGYILAARNESSEKNEREWKYEKFDTNLQSVKTTTIQLNSRFRNTMTHTDEERTHNLYQNIRGEYSLVTVEASDLTTIKIDGELPNRFRLKEMTILNDYAYLTGRLRKAPFLMAINWKTGEHKIIPITLEDARPKRTSIYSIQALEEENELIVHLRTYKNRRDSKVNIMILDANGEKLDVFSLTEDLEENIVDVSASKLSDGQYLFTGTYSKKFTSISEGLFVAQKDQGTVGFIEFYNFLDLENFLSYLPERKQARIEKRKERKKKRGQELAFNYRIAAHDIIPLEDGYLYLGEAFYPTYRTETYTTTGRVNGVLTTTTQTRQVFDGYQYTHAILAKFDLEGKLVWDEIFEMRAAYKPFFVKRFISIAERNTNAIKLVFSSRSYIMAKEFDFDGTVLLDYESEEIETGSDADKTKRSFSDISHWYDNYFIAYGFQKIKNTDKDDDKKRKRKVFFINKIRFE